MQPPTKYTIEQVSSVVDTPCWLWAGNIDFHGYGHTGRIDPVTGRMKNWRVHRLMYTCKVGPIPEGHALDHLCGIRHCINPAHMEPVTYLENTRRGNVGMTCREKTHCKWGHEFTEENTMWVLDKNGTDSRRCRKCEANRYLRAKERCPELLKEYQRRSDAKRSADPKERALRALRAREARARKKLERQQLLDSLAKSSEP